MQRFGCVVLLCFVCACQNGWRGIAPEASARLEEALRACADGDGEALWGMTAQQFRQSTSEEELELFCEERRLIVGSFTGLEAITNVERSIDFENDLMSLSFEGNFEAGSVGGDAVLANRNDAWRLVNINFTTADITPLSAEESDMMELASAQRDRLLSGDLKGFHRACSPGLRRESPWEEFEPELDSVLGAPGLPTGSGEPSVEESGEDTVVVYPLQYASGTGQLTLTLRWYGAAWAIHRFNVTTPFANQRRVPVGERTAILLNATEDDARLIATSFDRGALFAGGDFYVDRSDGKLLVGVVVTQAWSELSNREAIAVSIANRLSAFVADGGPVEFRAVDADLVVLERYDSDGTLGRGRYWGTNSTLFARAGVTDSQVDAVLRALTTSEWQGIEGVAIVLSTGEQGLIKPCLMVASDNLDSPELEPAVRNLAVLVPGAMSAAICDHLGNQIRTVPTR